MAVLVVDDERTIREAVARALRMHGYDVALAADGDAALQTVAVLRPEVIVLDLMMPRVDGIEVCKRLRASGARVPVLMLTARDAIADRVAGLEAGADDYLVKPFALEELQARLRAILRRREPADDHRLVVGDVTLDPLERRVWVNDSEVSLSRREFAMLTSLMDNRGHVVSRARLFDDVWGDEVDISSNALDVHMSRLRQHLAGSQVVTIKTMRGVGYRLEQTKR
jgi:DNA-binding response OmpR family regulator